MKFIFRNWGVITFSLVVISFAVAIGFNTAALNASESAQKLAYQTK